MLQTIRNFWFHLLIIAKTCVLTVKHMCQEACRSIPPLIDAVDRRGEYAVITGGNRGIGLYTLQGLVTAGMKVIAGCRDGNSRRQLFDSLKEAGINEEEIEWIQLDMSSLESVRNFAQKILEKNIPISLLINNAAIMFTPYASTRDGFEQQFQVNYLGHFLLSHLLLPKLVQAGTRNKQTRIVSVSSSLSSLNWLKLDDLQAKCFYNKWAAYSQSKLCQIMFTEMLNNHLNDSPVKCYSLCPGTIRSNWYQNDLPSKLFISIFGVMFKSEAEGASRVLFAAFSSQLENSNGTFLQNCRVEQPPSTANCPNLQMELWKKSCKLLAIDNFGQV